MVSQHDVPDGADAAGRTTDPLRSGRPAPRFPRIRTRRPLGRGQLIGLTAALAAVAGSGAVAASNDVTTAATGSSTDAPQLSAMTTARIDRRQLASRDGARFELSLQTAQQRQADAARQAAARTAKLAADRAAAQAAAQRQAQALSAAKAAATAKAAADARAAAAARQRAVAQQTAAKAAAKAAAQRAATRAAAVAKQRAAAARQAAIKSTARRAAAKAAAARQKAKSSIASASRRATLPTSGYRLTALFGQGGGRWARNHTGTDFAAPMGTPIRSVLAGKVVAATYAGAYGRQVKVRHANGTVTSYSHMSRFSVSPGQSVAAGGQVGAIGMTGNTTGPHLHFEVLLGGSRQVNPIPWLRGQGVNA